MNLLRVVLADGSKKLLNEEAVETISLGKNGEAIIDLFSGRSIIVSMPPFEEWDNDCITRKK